MSKVKGVDVLVRIGNKVLAGQRNATLNRGKDSFDSTTKDSEGWKENDPGNKEWSISADGLLVEGDEAYSDLEDAYMEDTIIDVDVSFPSGKKYTGKAFVTDFPLNLPYTDKVAYNVTLQGTGTLSKIQQSQPSGGE